jgi:argininosuccinate synthase
VTDERTIDKVALAFSGGLDTSVAVPWIKETYGADVVCVAVDVGQGDIDLDAIEERARAAGAVSCHVIDVRRDFVENFVWPTLRAGAVYGRKYLLGTAMARPLIAREVVRVARREDCDALAHGCTGKGNDQVRFELTFGRLAPDLAVIAPWREWEIRGRADAEAYGRRVGVPLPPKKTSVYSRDRNVWHVSHEGGPLENPSNAPEKDMFLITIDPSEAPAEGEHVDIEFEAGTPVAVNGERLDGLELLQTLNAIGGRHGVGRVDLIEDRIVGLKSRGVYETPGGTLLYAAHSELEQFVLDRRTLDLKDMAARRYATLVYEGRWWGTEKKALDALVEVTQERVTGTIGLHVCRGGVAIASRESTHGLYAEEYATFEASDLYDHSDATGFIRLFGLSYRIQGHGDLIPVEDPSERAAAGALPEGDWLD